MSTSAEAPVFGNLLADAWVQGSGGDPLEVRDPADLRIVVGRVPSMTPEDVGAAYQAAAAGLEVWRATGPLDRATVLQRAAHLLRRDQQDLAGLIVSEMGKTLAEAGVEVAKTADFFDFYASLARLPQGELLADARPGTRTEVRVEPVGVVLAITPWNDPLLTPARKLAPALAAGNAVVIKPSEESPLITLRLAQVLRDAGLPPGVLGTVTGSSRVLSDALLLDPRVAAVTFTGSTPVGRLLEGRLAGTGVRLQSETGGKNASVVLADADLELAASVVTSAAFAQSGQRCTATSRLVVDASVADAFMDLLLDRVSRIVVGPGRDPRTTMGPVVSKAQQRTALEHVVTARDAGARVVHGGRTPTDELLAHGCFVEPTVVDGVTPDMRLWREEVFGPVLAVATCHGLDEAVALVNDSAYGLAAAVFTTSLTASASFVERVDVGQVAVNLPTAGWDVHHPFGGFRDSGSPFKEQGTSGLRFYTRLKTAAVRHEW